LYIWSIILNNNIEALYIDILVWYIKSTWTPSYKMYIIYLLYQFLGILFSSNIKMFQHYVKEYDTLQLIMGFIQTKPTTKMTSFIFGTMSSISTTRIGIQLLFIFLCQNVPIRLEWYRFRLSDTHNLDTKHIVGMIQFPSFWYTQSRT